METGWFCLHSVVGKAQTVFELTSASSFETVLCLFSTINREYWKKAQAALRILTFRLIIITFFSSSNTAIIRKTNVGTRTHFNTSKCCRCFYDESVDQQLRRSSSHQFAQHPSQVALNRHVLINRSGCVCFCAITQQHTLIKHYICMQYNRNYLFGSMFLLS